jgi:hypothetical protein
VAKRSGALCGRDLERRAAYGPAAFAYSQQNVLIRLVPHPTLVEAEAALKKMLGEA